MAEMTREQAAEVLEKIANFAEVIPGGLEIHRTEKCVAIDALRIAIAALRQGWVRTEERVPTEEDGAVAVVGFGPLGNYVQYVRSYFHVVQNTHDYPYWMPLPPMPE